MIQEKAIMNLNKVLRQNGTLILTTPNVSRLENVAKMLQGSNIYDPYSAYGMYGRHNREFTVCEIENILRHCGFEVEDIFTSDVHGNASDSYYSVKKIIPLLD